MCLRDSPDIVSTEWPLIEEQGGGGREKFKERFDLQGRELAAVSLDWDPEVSILHAHTLYTVLYVVQSLLTYSCCCT